MNKILPLLPLLLVAVSAAAQPAPTFVRVWEGSIKVTSTFVDDRWTETIEGILRFEHEESAHGAHQYNLTGGTWTWRAFGGDESCTYSGGPTSYAFDSTLTSGRLHTWPDGLYFGGAPSSQFAEAFSLTITCGEDVTQSPPASTVLFLTRITSSGPDPSYRVQGDSLIAGTYTQVWDDEQNRSVFEWHFVADPQEMELEVDLEDYAEWIPQGGADEEAEGNGIAVVARLKSSDGGPVEEDAERFRFELVDVSREPGVAMNAPLPPEALSTPDLRITNVLNLDERDDEGQWATTKEGREAAAIVSSYDWGAHGYLRVTATLYSGREVVGYLKGDREKQQIPLPKRTSDSRIAIAWLESHGVAGQRDADDTENKPEGDGHSGDGLSLYEEYRGFHENGTHIYGDPQRKDLFVFDEVGGPTKMGIARFGNATGLAIHDQLRPTEHWDRVVNFNHDAGPHLVDQHGLRIVLAPEPRGYAAAETITPDGPPGTPRTIRYLTIPPNLVPGPSNQVPSDYYSATVAHELAHGVSIWHHGTNDERDVKWQVKLTPEGFFARDAAGNLLVEEVLAGGARQDIRILDERGSPAPILRILQQHGAITISQRGAHGGEHSGDTSCFMRYDLSPAYPALHDAALRYWVGRHGEPVGQSLCSAREGNGTNDASHAPQSRYGPARIGRCAQQICVNDLYTHPSSK